MIVNYVLFAESSVVEHKLIGDEDLPILSFSVFGFIKLRILETR